MEVNISQILQENNCKAYVRLYRFNGSHPAGIRSFPAGSGPDNAIYTEFNGGKWEIRIDIKATEQWENTLDFHILFKLSEGSAQQVCAAAGLYFDNWSRDNYVLMPAAAYNGNRFETRSCGYPPQLQDECDQRSDLPTIITDVPRLNIENGPSRIQLMSRDFSTPAAGFHAPHTKRGFWLLATQATGLGDTGIALEENEARDRAFFELTVPGMRKDTRYTICNNTVPSEDRAVDFREGDTAELCFRVCFFSCPDIQILFNKFSSVRKDLSGNAALRHILPFSGAWSIQEEKYNRDNWEDEGGYYSVGLRENLYQDWQIGWVGGLMATHPLLMEGSRISRDRALKTFDFVFNGGQDVSGMFHGCGHKGRWYGDCFKDHEKKWHLVRKSGDALYFLAKQFMLIDELNRLQKAGIELKKDWLAGAKRCADAFVKLWREYGQFGQFADTGTGKIIIGNSSSGGIVPAGLALAGQYFDSDEYIKTAEEAAEYYYTSFTRKGISTGGPGEILQCPDSESAFGLLESFVILYETTGKISWLGKASEMAYQCMTWCVSYDFRFPPESTFGRLDMQTTGTVYANVQNKHSAPGICTLSGDSLFKLYRYTRNKDFLELIREIAHSLPQYLSRKDRAIRASDGRVMPGGWMNERVEMSDWLEPVGEIFYGSCWSEVSCMLTYAEIPGIYIQADTGFICSIDHVTAEITQAFEDYLVVRVNNPTGFKAEVKVFVEKSADMGGILGQNAMLRCRRLALEPGRSEDMRIDRKQY